MVTAGLVGGTANFLDTRLDKERSSAEQRWHFARCSVLGLVGALCVPLFLSVIQSDILRSDLSANTVFVFTGLCLLAAFFSRRFLDTVAERALKLAEENKKQNDKIRGQVEGVIESKTEPDSDTMQHLLARLTSLHEPTTNDKRVNVLHALASEKYTFRSLTGVAADTRLSENDASNALRWLEQHSLAAQIDRKNGPRWYITAAGRAEIGARPPGFTELTPTTEPE